MVVDLVSALLIGVPALLFGVVAGLAVHAFARRRPRVETTPEPTTAMDLDLVRRSLDGLGIGVVVLDPRDEVVLANPAARRLGVVRDGRIGHSVLRAFSRQVRQIGEVRETEVELPRGRGLEPLGVRVRAAPLGVGGHAVMQVEDVTEAHRLANVRRDFVANVSHELKTPVGALSLLAEAMLDAVDDPAAVQRFASRMRHESGRLGRLVQELIELSRLQGADPLPEPVAVAVDQIVSEVVDRTRTVSEGKSISVVSGGERGLVVEGNENQLITALVNLVENAVTYSPERTRVAIGTRRRGHLIEISVSDQGMGITEGDLDRIFERFYRADPARSRATGGTGLGLAIVKHIATNHGGSVDVWSVEGSGSTFTIRLPDPGCDSPGFEDFDALEDLDEEPASAGESPGIEARDDRPTAVTRGDA
ncbi:sensor histidine kinase [Cryptosporangium sp. NPDC051539]|uniref:sensor histidine kinase n=1 Tax=Cryptosporangium sp. NPDC051539 TaxID=3363962 RepID=UPI00379D5042